MSWLETIAPTIARAIGGPLGGLAYEAIAKVFGVSQEVVKQMLDDGNMTSEQIAQVKIAEMELKKTEKELGLNFEALAVSDRKSARQMQTEVKSTLVPTLAVIIVISFITVVVGTLLGYSKIESAMAGTLVGYLSAKAEQVISFYFGSSSGSQAKDQMLWKSTPTEK
jgi:hypothetical protein